MPDRRSRSLSCQRHRPTRSTALASIVVALAVTLTLASCSSNKNASPVDLPSGGSAPSTLAPAAPASIAPTDGPVSQVATAKGDGVKVYAKAGDPTPKQTDPNPWLYNNEPNAKVPLVYLVKNDPGTEWLEVYLSSRPNGSTGFVKRSEVNVENNPYRLEVRVGDFTLKAYNGNQVVMDTKVALGADDAPTPGGLYFLNILIQNDEKKDPGYGPFAYGLSGHSEKITSFNGGDGQLGLHGTDHPELIGTQVSHGCIRLKNEDITKLTQLPLPLGTPIQILA